MERTYIRALGSLSLLLAVFSPATLASDTTQYSPRRGHDSGSHLRTAYEDLSEVVVDCLPEAGRLTATLRSRASTIEPALDCADNDTPATYARTTDARQNDEHKVQLNSLSSGAATKKRPAEPRDNHDEEDVEPFEGSFDIGVELELIGRRLNNFSLGQRSRDDVRTSEQEILSTLSYRPGERLSAFGEISLIAEQEIRADATPRKSEEGVERGETWVYLKRIFDSRYSMKIGRQNFLEPRRWWWDDDLDAVRLYYARDPWRLYVVAAEEIARTSSSEDFIDPEDEDVQRLMGQANWDLSETFNLAAFYLHQRDDSKSSPVGSVLETVREDESDADLRWVGLRATGDLGLSRAGKLTYWADTAVVTGDETLLEFEDDSPGLSRVASTQKRRVHGWGVDLGIIWTPLPRSPTLTVGYARGSGDRDLNDNTDRAFRQTGLQDKDEEFRQYGELLRPELSNLSIATVTIGFPVHADSRLTLGYHRFRQVYPAPFLREARIDIDPTGERKDIGSEIRLLVELRGWENLVIDIAAGTFQAGNAFGTAKGNRANSLFFKLTYEF